MKSAYPHRAGNPGWLYFQMRHLSQPASFGANDAAALRMVTQWEREKGPNTTKATNTGGKRVENTVYCLVRAQNRHPGTTGPLGVHPVKRG